MSRSTPPGAPQDWHPIAKPFAFLQTSAAARMTLIGLGLVAVLLVGLDFAGLRHASYWPETVPGIYGIIGFGTIVVVVALGYGLRWLLAAPADAYRVEGDDE